MVSINVVNVNGREFFLNGHDSFMDMMEYLGLGKEDVSDYATTETEKEEVLAGRACMRQDGIYGDDFYIFCEEMHNFANELDEVSKSLRAPSRKGNTRTDIAAQVDTIVSNMDTIIP